MTGGFNVLISSAGRRVALLKIFRRTLGNMGLAGKVVAADVSPLSSAFHSADEGVLVPRCTDTDFIPTMLDICREREISLLIPTIDTELLIYARHRDSFAEVGTTVAVSSPEVISIAGDKDETHSWLVGEEFPTVRQASLESFSANGQSWRFPLIVKPRKGSSSIGVSRVHDRAQLEAATRDGDYVVQTIASGDEFTLDVLADRAGKCVCAVPRRRIEVRAGEVSKGITVRSPELISLAQRMCDRLPGAYGPLNFQAFVDPQTQEINLIELNPRFGGGFPLTWQAGGMYPQWLIEEILGMQSTADASQWVDGLVMLRWDEAVFTTADQAGI